MTGQSLVRLDLRGLQMHRLTQAILRDQLTPASAAAERNRTESILREDHPDTLSSARSLVNWPGQY
jgi:hypothetical protein